MDAKRERNTLTRRIDRMLNDPKSPSKRRFDFLISCLVIISTSIVISVGFSAQDLLHGPVPVMVIDYAILLIFLVEYVGRVVFTRVKLPAVVRLTRAQRIRYQIQARLQWMMTPLAIADLLAIIPLFAWSSSVHALTVLRVLRVLRLLRLYRLVVVANTFDKLAKAFRNNALLYAVAFSLVAVTIVMGSIAFYVVEGSSNPNVAGPFDAVWWTVVTLTTVGYGDTVPSSGLGRIVAIILMLSGVILMAVFAGVMSQTMVGYLLDVREERVRMSATVNHFIICGWNSRGPMVAQELLHLVPEEEIIIFADHPEPQDLPPGVTFLRGNPIKEAEWDKVRLAVARNVVVLAPPTVADVNSSTADGYTALAIYTIRSYERKLIAKGIERTESLRIVAELLDPENYEHIQVAGADEVVHTTQVGSNLIAHSSIKPGMGRVVTELISWWGQGIDVEEVPKTAESGATFSSISSTLRQTEGLLVVGIVKADGSIALNPPDSHPVLADHKLVVIKSHPAE